MGTQMTTFVSIRSSILGLGYPSILEMDYFIQRSQREKENVIRLLSKPISGVASIIVKYKKRQKKKNRREKVWPCLYDLELGVRSIWKPVVSKVDVAYGQNLDPREDTRAQKPPLVG